MPKQGHTDPKLFDYAGDLSKEWYVGFRFTCPKRLTRKPVQVRLGINYLTTVKEREAEGKAVIGIVKDCLDNGWNPHDENIESYLKSSSESFSEPPAENAGEQMENYHLLPFNDALTFAYNEKKPNLKKKSKQAYESALKFAKAAATKLGIDKMEVSKTKKAHIKRLLKQMGEDRQAAYDLEGKGKIFTPNSYNKYKTYLSAFFDELGEWEAVEYNPCEKIKEKDAIETGVHRHATDKELEIIKRELPIAFPEMYNLLRFEFITGMRPDEILDTTFETIDWLNSCIRLSGPQMIVNKEGEIIGKTTIYREVPVPTFLLEWLRERAQDVPRHYYIFSRRLAPGDHRTTTNWLSRMWNAEVKQKLGINVSLYSFKGMGGDAKRDAGIETAAVSVGWGHSSTAMAKKVYLKKEGHRLRQQIVKNAPDL